MMEVRLKREKFQLSNWMPVGQKETPNWVRRLNPYDGTSCVGLMVSYSNVKSNRFCWAPMFHGKDLHELCDIYFSFYPSPQPYHCNGKCYSCLSPTLISFQDNQLQEAKNHLDQFIDRVNKLSVWI